MSSKEFDSIGLIKKGISISEIYKEADEMKFHARFLIIFYVKMVKITEKFLEIEKRLFEIEKGGQ